MATKYEETTAEPGDAEYNILEVLGQGRPWLFLTARSDGAGGLNMGMQAGGGVADTQTIRRMLRLALDAIPAGDPE